jgi:dihydrofolate reductase
MEDDAGFADKMNSMKKYVVSSTLTDPTWTNSEVLGPDLKAEIERIKAEPGGDILVAGSARLAQGLLALGQVDELRLMTFPIVLGSGKRLFADAKEPVTLALDSAQPLKSGTVILTYRKP